MLFEKAARLKLRFTEGISGSITAEDLWDLPLEHPTRNSLNNLAIALDKAVEDSGQKSFVRKKTKKDVILKLKFAIADRVIKVRLDEIEEKENELARKTHNEGIFEIIADKELEKKKGKSVSELKKMLR